MPRRITSAKRTPAIGPHTIQRRILGVNFSEMLGIPIPRNAVPSPPINQRGASNQSAAFLSPHPTPDRSLVSTRFGSPMRPTRECRQAALPRAPLTLGAAASTSHPPKISRDAPPQSPSTQRGGLRKGSLHGWQSMQSLKRGEAIVMNGNSQYLHKDRQE